MTIVCLQQPEESEGSPGQATIRSISKDEEEVVETLYALAGMFSDTENTHKIDSDGKPSKGKSLALPEAENSMPVFKGLLHSYVCPCFWFGFI